MKRSSPGGDLAPKTLAEYKLALREMTKERNAKQEDNERLHNRARQLESERDGARDTVKIAEETVKELSRKLDTANETSKALAGKMAEADRGRAKAEEKLAESEAERHRLYSDMQRVIEEKRTLERGLGATNKTLREARNLLLSLAPLDGSGQ